MFRSRRTWIIASLLGILLLLAASWYQQAQRYKHFSVHDRGMVYRSAWIEPDAISDLIETYQIRTVVNLCSPGEMSADRWQAEEEAVTQAGATLIREPLSTSYEVDEPSIAREIEILKNPDNYPMLVHCRQGVTRTAKFLMIYDVLFRGMSAEESLAAQPLFGRDEHDANVRTFAREFERRHAELYPTASADNLKILR